MVEFNIEIDGKLKKLKISNKIGAGYYSTVYKTCESEDDCKYVAKFILRDSYKKREYKFSKLAAELDLAPNVYRLSKEESKKIDPEKKYKILIFERMQMTLKKAFNKNYVRLKDAHYIIFLLKKLKEYNLTHMDLHIENIMVNVHQNKIINMKIIDWEFAEEEYYLPEDFHFLFKSFEETVFLDAIKFLKNYLKLGIPDFIDQEEYNEKVQHLNLYI
jgi:hypothetical protein